MNFVQKVDILRSIIRDQLIPLISDSYVFLDLPYYTNIGDVLIWEGTETFLSSLPAKCLYRCSCQTFSYRPLPKNTTILLQGGGINPAKRNVMVVKNEMRLLKQKRNVLQI